MVAQLDASSYAIAKEIADIQVNQVSDEFDRLQKLRERNSLSESDFKNVGFRLQAAKAQQKLHNKNLKETELYAPISGMVFKKLAEPGEIVSTGMPILVISDLSKVKVNAYIPENQLQSIRIGQTASGIYRSHRSNP